MSVDQIGIAVFGVTAVFLSQARSRQHQRWACIFGLVGQVFWFYTAINAKQVGVIVLVVLYTAIWMKGFVVYWILKEKPASASDESEKAKVEESRHCSLCRELEQEITRLKSRNAELEVSVIGIQQGGRNIQKAMTEQLQIQAKEITRLKEENESFLESFHNLIGISGQKSVKIGRLIASLAAAHEALTYLYNDRFDSLGRKVSDVCSQEAEKRVVDVLANKAGQAAHERWKKMEAVIVKANEDVKWMLNNKKFLNPEAFDYLFEALEAKGDGK